MTKAEIVATISKQTGLDREAVLNVVEKFMYVIKENLAEGNEVFLRGFGSFIIKTRARKTARNISQDKSIIIPEHNIPAFKPAKVFVSQVSGEVINEE